LDRNQLILIADDYSKNGGEGSRRLKLNSRCRGPSKGFHDMTEIKKDVIGIKYLQSNRKRVS
jgi:hypothetical protein